MNLTVVSTFITDSDRWVTSRESDFIDIILDYAIRLQRIEVFNGSNVRMYSLRMIDDDDEGLDLEDLTSTFRLLLGDSNRSTRIQGTK